MIKIFDSLIMDYQQNNLPREIPEDGFYLITCGLSQKSSITASSIGDDGFVYCIQRSFKTRSGKILEPQEFKVCWLKKPENLYPYLETVTLLLILDVPPVQISDNILFLS